MVQNGRAEETRIRPELRRHHEYVLVDDEAFLPQHSDGFFARADWRHAVGDAGPPTDTPFPLQSLDQILRPGLCGACRCRHLGIARPLAVSAVELPDEV